MAFPSTPGLIKAEFRYTWAGQLVENVIHINNNGVNPSSAQLVSLGGALKSWWQGNLQALQAGSVELREIYLETYVGFLSISHTEVVAEDGSNVAESMPNNVTLCMSLRSGFTGRNRRGRLYHIGLSVDQVNHNTVLTSTRNALLAAYSALQAAIDTEGMIWVVASFTFNGEPLSEADTVPITAVTVVDDTVDSQRRRLPGRGN